MDPDDREAWIRWLVFGPMPTREYVDWEPVEVVGDAPCRFHECEWVEALPGTVTAELADPHWRLLLMAYDEDVERSWQLPIPLRGARCPFCNADLEDPDNWHWMDMAPGGLHG